MAFADGASFSGGNGWIFEVSTWDKMPLLLNDYLQIWYPRVFPIYLAMAQAVEKVPSDSCIPSWQCSTWSTCTGGSQSRTCSDVNNCNNPTGKPSEKQSCVCSPTWICGNWGTCTANVQSRTCTDTSKCALDKTETQSCGTSGLQGSWDLSTNFVEKIKGNKALAYGNTIFVNDPTYGSALRFKESNSYLKIEYVNGSLAPRDGFTVDVKVKFNSVRHIHIVRDTESYLLQRVYVSTTVSRFQAGVYSNNRWTPVLSSGTNLQTNRWYQATYTYDKKSGVFKLYLDKKLNLQKTWSGAVDVSQSSQIIIGNRAQLDRWLDGSIRDVRIYNRALSAAEVLNLP